MQGERRGEHGLFDPSANRYPTVAQPAGAPWGPEPCAMSCRKDGSWATTQSTPPTAAS